MVLWQNASQINQAAVVVHCNEYVYLWGEIFMGVDRWETGGGGVVGDGGGGWWGTGGGTRPPPLFSSVGTT